MHTADCVVLVTQIYVAHFYPIKDVVWQIAQDCLSFIQKINLCRLLECLITF